MSILVKIYQIVMLFLLVNVYCNYKKRRLKRRLFICSAYDIKEYLVAQLQILVQHTEGLQHLHRAHRKQGFVE